MSFPSGKRLGPYEILSPLGAGGMGEVYKARDTRLGRDVAVKVISARLAGDAGALSRFEREAKAVAALSHPNILSIFDFGHEGDVTYAVMELLEGQTLRERLSGGAMPASKAMDIASQIAEGLAAAHEKGIVHRDLKPANVFVTKAGRVKILDFGLAKLRTLEAAGGEPPSEMPTAEAQTSAGAVLGTLGYMAPEQARGMPADARSDIFAFGVVLYEMVAGRRAFQGDTASDMLVALLTADPDPLPPATPAPLDRIVRRCLEKRPEDRFQSAHDLALALEVASSGPATPAPATPAPTPPPSAPAGSSAAGPAGSGWFRRHGVKVIAGSAAALLIAIAGGWALWLRGGKPAPAAPTLNPTRVAVAVFDNRTGDPSLDPIGRMACDWITQGLSQIPDMEAVPSSAVFRFEKAERSAKGDAGRGGPLDALANQTGSGRVVSGSYYLQGRAIQFQAKITDGASGRLLYASDPIAGSRDEPMKALEVLRQRLMGAIAVGANASIKPLILQPPLYEAYREYIAGLQQFGEDYGQAIAHFAKAAQIDPNFALPRLYIAVAYSNMALYEKANAIVSGLNRNRESLAPLDRAYLDWERAGLAGHRVEAIEALREAERLDPHSPVTCYAIGVTSLAANRPKLAVDTLTRLSPMGDLLQSRSILSSWSLYVLAAAYHVLADYDRELAVSDFAGRKFPDVLSAHEGKIRALAGLGRAGEILQVIDDALAVPSREGTAGELMLQAALELRAHGDRQGSMQVATRAVDWLRSRYRTEKAGANDLGLARALYAAERWDEARVMFKGLSDDHPVAKRQNAGTPAQAEGREESESLRVSEAIGYLGPLGALAARRGDREGALRISDELAKIDTAYLFGGPAYWRASIAALLGDKPRAVDLLREAFAQGKPYDVDLHRDMNLEPLHGYPPFEELIKPKG